MALLALPNIVKGYSFELNNVQYKTRIEEFKPTIVAAKTEIFNVGGMLGDLELPVGGIAAMSSTFKMVEHLTDLYRLIGKTVQGERVFMTLRAVLNNGVETSAYVIKSQGFLKNIDPQAITRGTKQMMNGEFIHHTFTVLQGGNEILHIDVPSNIIRIDGVVVNADENAILGSI